MTIAITGASGVFGRAAAEHLLDRVDPGKVVLITRRPEALADLADRGADVRRADFTVPETLDPAFRGVHRLLLISMDTIGARLEQHRAAVAAAARQGVRHVVYTSVPEPVPGNPALVVPDHAGTEQALAQSPMTATMMRNNLYAHLQLAALEQAAATGKLVTNAGSGGAAYVTRDDCVAAAAEVLIRESYEDAVYDVTGPRAYTADDLARMAGARARRTIEVVPVDDESFAAGLRSAGLPEPVADLITRFGAATREGYLASVTSVVPDLTGREATPLEALLAGSPV